MVLITPRGATNAAEVFLSERIKRTANKINSAMPYSKMPDGAPTVGGVRAAGRAHLADPQQKTCANLRYRAKRIAVRLLLASVKT